MNTKELSTKRKELESKIFRDLSEAVGKFRIATGHTPHAIKVNLVEVNLMHSELDEFKQYGVESVKVSIEI